MSLQKTYDKIKLLPENLVLNIFLNLETIDQINEFIENVDTNYMKDKNSTFWKNVLMSNWKYQTPKNVFYNLKYIVNNAYYILNEMYNGKYNQVLFLEIESNMYTILYCDSEYKTLYNTYMEKIELNMEYIYNNSTEIQNLDAINLLISSKQKYYIETDSSIHSVNNELSFTIFENQLEDEIIELKSEYDEKYLTKVKYLSSKYSFSFRVPISYQDIFFSTQQ